MVFGKKSNKYLLKHLALLLCLNLLIQNASGTIPVFSQNTDTLSPKSILNQKQDNSFPHFSSAYNNLSQDEVIILENVLGTDNALSKEVLKDLAGIEKKDQKTSFAITANEKIFKQIIHLMRRPDYLPPRALASLYTVLLEKGMIDASYILGQLKNGDAYLKSQVIEALILMDEKYITTETVNVIFRLLKSVSELEQKAAVEFFILRDSKFMPKKAAKTFFVLASSNSQEKRAAVVKLFAKLDKSLITEETIDDIFRLIESRSDAFIDVAIDIFGVLDKSIITPEIVSKILAILREASDFTKEIGIRLFTVLDKSFVTPEIATAISKMCRADDADVAVAASKFVAGLDDTLMPKDGLADVFTMLVGDDRYVKAALGAISRMNIKISGDVLLDIAVLLKRNNKDINGMILDILTNSSKVDISKNTLKSIVASFENSSPDSKILLLNLLGKLEKDLITQDVLDGVIAFLDDDIYAVSDAAVTFLTNSKSKVMTSQGVKELIDLLAKDTSMDTKKAAVKVLLDVDKKLITKKTVDKLYSIFQRTKGLLRKEIVYVLAKADSSLITPVMVKNIFAMIDEIEGDVPFEVVRFLSLLSSNLITQDITAKFFEMLKSKKHAPEQAAVSFFSALDKSLITADFIFKVSELLKDNSQSTKITAVQLLDELDKKLITSSAVKSVADLLTGEAEVVVRAALFFLNGIDETLITEDLVDKIISLHQKSASMARSAINFFKDSKDNKLSLKYKNKLTPLLTSKLNFVRQEVVDIYKGFAKEEITFKEKQAISKLLNDSDLDVKKAAMEFFIKHDKAFITPDVVGDMLDIACLGEGAVSKDVISFLETLGSETVLLADLDKIVKLLSASDAKAKIMGVSCLALVDKKLITPNISEKIIKLLLDADMDVCAAAIDFLASAEDKYISDAVSADIISLANDPITGNLATNYVEKALVKPFTQIAYNESELLLETIAAVEHDIKINKDVSLPLNIIFNMIQKSKNPQVYFKQILSLSDRNVKGTDITSFLKILDKLNAPKEVMTYLFKNNKHALLMDFIKLLIKDKNIDMATDITAVIDEIMDDMGRAQIDSFYMVKYMDFFATLPSGIVGQMYKEKLSNIYRVLLKKVKDEDEDFTEVEVFKILMLVKNHVSDKERARMFMDYLDENTQLADYIVESMKDKKITEAELNILFKTIFEENMLEGTRVITQSAFYDTVGITEDEEVMGYLVKAFKAEKNKTVKSSIASFLETYYENIEELFSLVYPEYSKDLEEFYQIVPDLRYMDCIGFRSSFFTDIEALRDFIKQLKITQNIMGKEDFKEATQNWTSLSDITMVLPLRKTRKAVDVLGYSLPHSLENIHSQDIRPTDNFASIDFIKSDDREQDLRERYLDFQENLINANFAALELINKNSAQMTKAVAFKIIEYAEKMLDTFSTLDSFVAMQAGTYLGVIKDTLEDELMAADFNDNIPSHLIERIIRLEDNMENVHSVIRFIHQKSTEALSEIFQNASANIKVNVFGKKITVANLGEEPVVRDGKIINKSFREILRAVEKIKETYDDQPFVIADNYMSWSCSLGEHRVELNCDLNVPDEGGFLKIRYFEGGDDIGNDLRRHYLITVLQGLGMDVNISYSKESSQYMLDAVFDKDHGAFTSKEIEYALMMALRSFHYTANLDWGLEAMVDYLRAEKSLKEEEAYKAGIEVVTDMANIYLAEETMPFYTRSRTEQDISLYHGYQMYKSKSTERATLLTKLNEALRALGYPQIPEGMIFGQKVIDKYYIEPVRAGLAVGELTMNNKGMPEKNKNYDVFADVLQNVTEQDIASMQTALSLNMLPEESLDYKVKGYVGSLALVAGKIELDFGGWVFVNGLKDPNTGNLFYASVVYGKSDFTHKKLTPKEVVEILQEEGYSIALHDEVSPRQRRATEKLLNAVPAENEEDVVRGIAASVGEGQWVVGEATFDVEYYKNSANNNQIFVAPYTTPDDLEAIKSAKAVLTTGGGVLSHAGITTREFGIPAVILTESMWNQSAKKTQSLQLFSEVKSKELQNSQGLWISRNVETVTKEIKNNDILMVNGKDGKVKVFPEASQQILREANSLIADLEYGSKMLPQVEKWLLDKSTFKWYKLQKNKEQENKAFADAVELILVAALNSQALKENQQGLPLIAMLNKMGKTKFPDAAVKRLKEIKERFFNQSLARMEIFLEDLEEQSAKTTNVKKLERLLAELEKQFEDTAYVTDVLFIEKAKMASVTEEVSYFERILQKRYEELTAIGAKNIKQKLEKDFKQEDLPEVRKLLRNSTQDVAAANIKNIIFVCTGNTCRSPMAEYMMKKMLKEAGMGNVKVLSRGTAADAAAQNSISSHSKTVLAEYGINDFIHNSNVLTQEDVDSADLILTMGDTHSEFVAQEYLEKKDKVFRLMDFGKNEDINIKDPYGKSLDVYREIGSQIKDAVSGVFNRLEYAASYAKLQQIEKELTLSKKHNFVSHEKLVYGLDEIDDDYIDVVGGKSAKLGQILKTVKEQGAYVPAGFAVSTNAFEKFLQENKIEKEFTKLTAKLDAVLGDSNVADAVKQQTIQDYSDKIRSLIDNGTISEDGSLGSLLLFMLNKNALTNKYLAVRSSAVQEDTEEAAFAGAAETYLYVDKENVLDKIKENWMSFWLPRGISYRAEQGVLQADVKPAVTVQEMADSEKAGVIFTSNPVTKKDEVVINSSYGLGEVVVSGFVQGDMYIADKADGEESEFPFIGTKRIKIIRNEKGKGTQEVVVKPKERISRSLSKLEVKKLTKIAVALEEYFGYALDIEFAINGSRIAILQARPITTGVSDKKFNSENILALSEQITGYLDTYKSASSFLSPIFMKEKQLKTLLSNLGSILRTSPELLKDITALSYIDVMDLSNSVKKLLKQDGEATREEFVQIAVQIARVEAAFADINIKKLPKSIFKNILNIQKTLVLLKAEEALKANNLQQDTLDGSLEGFYKKSLDGIEIIRTAA